MSDKTDLRIERTKKFIKEAFYNLVSERGFEAVTISDIADKAMINRATFYLHYQDKYDLLNKLETEVLEGIKANLSEVTKETTPANVTDVTLVPHILDSLTYVQDNYKFFNMIVNDNVDPSFLYRVGENLIQLLYEVILPELRNNNLLKKYGKHVIIAIFSSVVTQWIKEGMTDSKDDIAKLTTRMASIIMISMKDFR